MYISDALNPDAVRSALALELTASKISADRNKEIKEEDKHENGCKRNQNL